MASEGKKGGGESRPPKHSLDYGGAIGDETAWAIAQRLQEATPDEILAFARRLRDSKDFARGVSAACAALVVKSSEAAPAAPAAATTATPPPAPTPAESAPADPAKQAAAAALEAAKKVGGFIRKNW